MLQRLRDLITRDVVPLRTEQIVDLGRQEFLSNAQAIGPGSSLSAVWNGNVGALETTVRGAGNAELVCEIATSFGHFTFPRLVTDAHFERIRDDYFDWLNRHGAWRLLPPMLSETPHAVANSTFEAQGRRLSIGLLLHLCVLYRLLANRISLGRVLEIGGGFGALARLIKLASPGTRYVIMDLPESLFFSSTFLRLHFPRARTVYVASPSDLNKTADFMFVPAHRVDWLDNQSFDLAINVNSLGEMLQPTVDRYMRLINGGRIKHFYGINRFGEHTNPGLPGRDGRKCTPDLADMSMWFDDGWSNLIWAIHDESDGFSQIEPAAPPYLEVLMRRGPGDALGSGDNHRDLWSRAWKDRAARKHYGEFLRQRGWVEADWLLRD